MIIEFPDVKNSTTGKGQFLGRLAPCLESLGAKIVFEKTKNADIKLHLVKIKNPCSGKNIIRFNGVNVNTGTKSGNERNC